MNGWVGFDLDGTLAEYHGWEGPEAIGKPIIPMVRQAEVHLAEGREVRIFTARVYPFTIVIRNLSHLPSTDVLKNGGLDAHERSAYLSARAIFAWSREVFGRELPITCVKDFAMIQLYDDRCIQVETNTGRLIR